MRSAFNVSEDTLNSFKSKEEIKFTHHAHLELVMHDFGRFITHVLTSRAEYNVVDIYLNDDEDVIVNGDSITPVASASAGTEGLIPPKTAKQKLARKNELKAQSTLMLAIPDEHLLKFHVGKDVKSLWEEIKNRFGGNKESKKMLKTILKQNYENFAASSKKDWIKPMIGFRSSLVNLKFMDLNGKETIGFDKTKVECYNCHRRGHFARVCRAPRNQGNRNRYAPRSNALEDISTTNALVVQNGIGGYDWGFQAEEGLTNFSLMAYTSQGLSSSSCSSSSDFEVHTCSKECLKSYEALQKEYDQQRETLNKSNLEIIDLKNQLENALKEKDDLKLKLEKFKTSFKDQTKLINSQISAKDKTGLGYNCKINESDLNDIHVNESEVLDNVFDSVFDSRESDGDDNQVNDRFKKGEGYHAVPPPYTGNYMPPELDIKDENVFKPKEVKKIVKASFEKIKFVNDMNTTVENESKVKKPRKFSPSPRAALLTKSRQVPVNAAKQSSNRAAASVSAARRVNTVASRPNVNDAYQQHILILKHLHQTGKLDFEDVNFVKELKFNFFSVSQMYDKKNNVLFTHTECVVVSPDFKLLDESQVLLKVPKNNNLYSFDLKNVVPLGGLTCLFAKATLDESNLSHRRLGYINFKTMNKLERRNLVRGLPSKIFENDHTCVPCQKGKQHKASCKTKTGIRREFSVALTPQQNGVAQKKNRTLIEVDRTMLADSKLPTTFWAEAVNTACYVQNRVLVIKPYNKTPYELFLGRKPTLSFMRPFERLVTILNTLDHLGIKANIDSGQAKKKTVPDEVADDAKKESTEVPRKEKGVQDLAKEESAQRIKFKSMFRQDKDANENSTYRMYTPVSTAGSSYVNLGGSIPINAAALPNVDLPTDPLMPDFEDNGIFSGTCDDEVEGAVADFNNLELTIVVSPIPSTRIHKDRPKEQIIGDPLLAPQTRRITKIS
nr:ribonuclease H-like domain-containing protein [Tanacetum cinerariifolium]